MDIFNTGSYLHPNIVREYFERNQRKKEDEKWLKQNKPYIEEAMKTLGKDKADVEGFRVSIVTPDTSHFNMDKVKEFLLIKQKEMGFEDELVFKKVVDEEALASAIEDGIFDLEELKAYAWVESSGTPRLTIGRVRNE